MDLVGKLGRVRTIPMPTWVGVAKTGDTMGNLRNRIKRLEKAAGGNFQPKLRLLAAKMGVEAETLIEAARGHEARLNLEIRGDGIITWEGYPSAARGPMATCRNSILARNCTASAAWT